MFSRVISCFLFASLAISTTVAQADFTIEFPNVTPMNDEYWKDLVDRKSLDFRTYLKKQAKVSDCSKLLAEETGRNLLSAEIKNGLITTMFRAYSSHLPLVLRPDDIWLAIGAGFSNYVSTHPKELRGQLVTRRNLVVQLDGALIDGVPANQQWAEAVRLFDQEIQKRVKGDIQKWLVPEFSTTTETDRTVARMLCMSSVKEYFTYTGWLSCGLPKVTLTGSLEDWQNLRVRAEHLLTFDGELAQWGQLLLPVLDQFIETYQGKIDADFWQRIVTHKALSSGGGGPWKVHGWAMVFAPFNSEGKYNLLPAEVVDRTKMYADVLDDQIPETIVTIPVKLKLANGAEKKLKFIGGLTQPRHNDDRSVQTNVGWAVVEEKDQN